MAKNSSRTHLDAQIGSLYTLPLADFINARNALATQLKKAGKLNDAALIKTLTKPSVSAWAVNQLYWDHRDEFDELMSVGQRLRKLQTSGISGKVSEMRASLDARRDALTQLSDLATSLLEEAGHSPAPDTLRRITSTLEAMSSAGLTADGPTPGRLSGDVDPPGFESLTSFIPASLAPPRGKSEPEKKTTHLKLVADATKRREAEEARHADTAAARVAVQTAKKALADARAKVQSLESAQKKAYAESKHDEKQRREAEEHLKKLTVIAEASAEQAQTLTNEFNDATELYESAKGELEAANKELEKLLGG